MTLESVKGIIGQKRPFKELADGGKNSSFVKAEPSSLSSENPPNKMTRSDPLPLALQPSSCSSSPSPSDENYFQKAKVLAKSSNNEKRALITWNEEKDVWIVENDIALWKALQLNDKTDIETVRKNVVRAFKLKGYKKSASKTAQTVRIYTFSRKSPESPSLPLPASSVSSKLSSMTHLVSPSPHPSPLILCTVDVSCSPSIKTYNPAQSTQPDEGTSFSNVLTNLTSLKNNTPSPLWIAFDRDGSPSSLHKLAPILLGSTAPPIFSTINAPGPPKLPSPTLRPPPLSTHQLSGMSSFRCEVTSFSQPTPPSNGPSNPLSFSSSFSTSSNDYWLEKSPNSGAGISLLDPDLNPSSHSRALPTSSPTKSTNQFPVASGSNHFRSPSSAGSLSHLLSPVLETTGEQYQQPSPFWTPTLPPSSGSSPSPELPRLRHPDPSLAFQGQHRSVGSSPLDFLLNGSPAMHSLPFGRLGNGSVKVLGEEREKKEVNKQTSTNTLQSSAISPSPSPPFEEKQLYQNSAEKDNSPLSESTAGHPNKSNGNGKSSSNGNSSSNSSSGEYGPPLFGCFKEASPTLSNLDSNPLVKISGALEGLSKQLGSPTVALHTVHYVLDQIQNFLSLGVELSLDPLKAVAEILSSEMCPEISISRIEPASLPWKICNRRDIEITFKPGFILPIYFQHISIRNKTTHQEKYCFIKENPHPFDSISRFKFRPTSITSEDVGIYEVIAHVAHSPMKIKCDFSITKDDEVISSGPRILAELDINENISSPPLSTSQCSLSPLVTQNSPHPEIPLLDEHIPSKVSLSSSLLSSSNNSNSSRSDKSDLESLFKQDISGKRYEFLCQTRDVQIRIIQIALASKDYARILLYSLLLSSVPTDVALDFLKSLYNPQEFLRARRAVLNCLPFRTHGQSSRELYATLHSLFSSHLRPCGSEQLFGPLSDLQPRFTVDFSSSDNGQSSQAMQQQQQQQQHFHQQKHPHHLALSSSNRGGNGSSSSSSSSSIRNCNDSSGSGSGSSSSSGSNMNGSHEGGITSGSGNSSSEKELHPVLASCSSSSSTSDFSSLYTPNGTSNPMRLSQYTSPPFKYDNSNRIVPDLMSRSPYADKLLDMLLEERQKRAASSQCVRFYLKEDGVPCWVIKDGAEVWSQLRISGNTSITNIRKSVTRFLANNNFDRVWERNSPSHITFIWRAPAFFSSGSNNASSQLRQERMQLQFMDDLQLLGQAAESVKDDSASRMQG